MQEPETGSAVRAWIFGGLVLIVSAAGACGDDDGSSSPDSGAHAGGYDAGPNGLPTVPIIDASFEYPDSGMACNLTLGVRCDGDEDCGGSQVCCGTYDQTTLAYLSMECADSCDGASQRKLCHPGEVCPSADHVCRRSSLLPFDFVSVCATPAVVMSEQEGAAVEGEINCGTSTCEVGVEQCCLAAHVTMQPAVSVMALESHCAPVSEACECGQTAVAPPVDAGGENEDAGGEDGG